ncbi:MAG TPA: tryptophan-rich sensory protein [Bacteroides sp.]|nr:tryptophan-rich sensory protein [Bacteroides sp.]
MKKIYALTNLLVIVAVIAWNYVANTGLINGNSVGSVSAQLYNLFTPAGYAFSIWGLIYLGLLAHGIFQVKRAFFDKKDDEFILQIGPWLIIANLANAAWIWFWLNEQTGISVFMIILILISLLIIVIRLNMERWDAPAPMIVWTWWPISLYSGWITVATVANITAYLAKIEWQALFSDVKWTMILIMVATIINLLMILFRNMREFAAVGVWAILAIAVRHWGEIPVLQWTALICTILMLLAIFIHAYRNLSTNPFVKRRAAA